MSQRPTCEELEQRVRLLEKENKALRQSGERLRLLSSITENMSDSVVATNAKFEITYLNKKAEELFGYSLEEVRGQLPDIFNAEPNVDEIQTRLYETISSGNEYAGEYFNKKKNGTKFLCEFKIFPLIADKGETYAYVGIQRDVTEQRRAEAALKESNEILSGVLQHTHMMAVYLDTAFNFIWVNQAYADSCRQERSYFAGKNHFHLYPHEENQAIFQKVVDTGEPFFVEAKAFEFPDQPERGVTYWDWSLNPVKNELGAVIGLVFTLSEVTARVRAEDALRLNEEKFRLIAENSAEDIWQLDLEGNVTYASPAVERIFGYTQEETTRLGFGAFICESHMDAAVNAFARAKAGKQYQLVQIMGKKKDGAGVPIEVSITPVRKKKKIIGVQGIARDVSERERIEARLRESESRYRTIFEKNLNPIAIVDKKGRYLEANQAFCDFVETDMQTLRQMRVFDFSPPGQGGSQQQADHRHAWDSGGVLETEYLVGGRVKTLELCITPIQFQKREAVVGIGVDTTERKKSEAALRESEEKFRSLVEQAAEMLFFHDLEGNLIDVNLAAAQNTGYSKEEPQVSHP